MKIYRKKNGQFERNDRAYMKMLVIGTMVILPWSIAYYQYTEMSKPQEYKKQETKNIKVDSKIIKIMKQEVVKMVRYSEVNRELDKGELFYTNDPHSSILEKCNKVGGKRGISCDSWGVFQFKIPTVQFYYQKLYNKELTEMEAMLIALDEKKATKLAEDIIFKVEGGVWEWSGAKKNKAYLSKQIPFIRELEASL